jgi:hypothetical protein
VKSLIIAGALCVAMGAGTCFAGTSTQTRSVALQDTLWNETLSFDQWDPAEHVGQKLVQVDISIGGSVYNVATWSITKGTHVTFTATVEAILEAYRTWGDNGLLVQADAQGSVSYTSMTAPRSGVDELLGTAYPELYASTLSGDLSAFTGTSTVGIDVGATGIQGYSITGANAAGSCTFETTRASADAEVTYTWVEVPEPATTGLFLVGLVGLGAVARRRREAG